MIIPYSMIPVNYLKPLNVETKMEYTIDKKKFPGLSIKSERALPTLMISSETKYLVEDGVDKPMDLSKKQTTQNNTDGRKRVRRDVVTQAKSKRLHLKKEKESTAFKTDAPRTPAEARALDTVTSPEVSRSTQSSHSTPSQISSWERPLSLQSIPSSDNSCLAAIQPRSTTTVSTHPSYLDFIYGANGLLAQMASKSKKTSSLNNKSNLIQPFESKHGKRKREDESAYAFGDDFVQQSNKKVKTGCTANNNVSRSKVHTIHYMPTANSIMCDKASLGEGPAVWLSQSHHLWSVPTIDGISRLIPATTNPSRKLGPRQS